MEKVYLPGSIYLYFFFQNFDVFGLKTIFEERYQM